MKYVKLFEMQEGLKMNTIKIFIMCLILFSFMLQIVEAKTADEWITEGIELDQAGK